ESATRLKTRGGASAQFEPPPLRVTSPRIAVAPCVRSSRARRSISAVSRLALARSIESAQLASQGAWASRCNLAHDLFADLGRRVLAEQRDAQDAEGAAPQAQEAIRKRLASKGCESSDLGEIDTRRR